MDADGQPYFFEVPLNIILSFRFVSSDSSYLALPRHQKKHRPAQLPVDASRSLNFSAWDQRKRLKINRRDRVKLGFQTF